MSGTRGPTTETASGVPLYGRPPVRSFSRQSNSWYSKPNVFCARKARSLGKSDDSTRFNTARSNGGTTGIGPAAVGVGPDERLPPPPEDGTRPHPVRDPVQHHAPRLGSELFHDRRQLLIEALGGIGLTAQPAAADGAAPERQKHPGVTERREDGGLDLVERELSARHRVPDVVECARYLADAVRRIQREVTANRVVVHDGTKHERVVGVQPEGDPLPGRPAVETGRHVAQGAHVAIQSRPLGAQRAVVDEPVAHVQVEDAIQRLVDRSLACSLRRCNGPRARHRFRRRTRCPPNPGVRCPHRPRRELPGAGATAPRQHACSNRCGQSSHDQAGSRSGHRREARRHRRRVSSLRPPPGDAA